MKNPAQAARDLLFSYCVVQNASDEGTASPLPQQKVNLMHKLMCAAALIATMTLPASAALHYELNELYMQPEAVDISALPLFGDAPRYVTYQEFISDHDNAIVRLTQIEFMLPEILMLDGSEVPPSLRQIDVENPEGLMLVGVYADGSFRSAVLLID